MNFLLGRRYLTGIPTTQVVFRSWFAQTQGNAGEHVAMLDCIGNLLGHTVMILKLS